MFSRLHPLPLLLVLLALAVIPIRLLQRLRAESRNRAVELVLDYNQLRQLTAVTGQDLPRAEKMRVALQICLLQPISQAQPLTCTAGP